MTYKSQLGKLGEDIACKYLVNKGYKIIDRNFRKPWGEIDIITKAPNKTLVFVEVKTIRQNSGLTKEEQLQPEDQLTKSKLQKLKRTASLYAGHCQDLIKDNKGWKIDLIAITLSEPNKLTIEEKSCLVRHYENIA